MQKIKYLLIGFIIIFVVATSFSFLGTIGAGERGVLLRFGAVTGKTFDEGLYFKFPYIDKVIVMDIKVQKEQVEAESASKDLQSVTSVIALNFHIDGSKVGKIYQEVGILYRDRLIDPSIQESIKASTARFTAEELITKRETVREDIKNLLKEKLEGRGILIDDINIVNFSFSQSFNKAIEEKVTAEQEALAAKNKLERIKFEAEQKIEEAKGKAEATRIEAEALKGNPQVLQLRALEKWDGVMPKVFGGNGAVPFIDISGIINTSTK